MLCVIPARGGSKGIPNKNLRELAGKPLIVWTIEHALELQKIHPEIVVLVSTDSVEIAGVAQAAGAEVPWLRPPELAQDDTATEPVVLHALAEFSKTQPLPTAVMLLQATSPIRNPNSLNRAVTQFQQTKVDSLVGVVPVPPFIWAHTPDGLGHAFYDFENRPRRQDLNPGQLRYRETGSIYLTKTQQYLENQNRLGGNIGLFIMDETEGIDIDTEFDFQLAAQFLTK